MSVTIQQLLELDVFKEARLVSGKNGLSKSIKRVSFFDCPPPQKDDEKELIKEGDFYITSFYFVKDSFDEMGYILKLIIENQTSGLVIIDNYLSTLPDKLLSYAEKYNYPIFFMDKDTPYADIISSIMELIISDQENKIMEMKVSQLLRPDLDFMEKKKILFSINSNLKDFISTIYYSNSSNTKNKFLQIIIKDINKKKEWSAFNYKDGVLFILSSDSSTHLDYEMNNLLSQIKDIGDGFAVGISKIHNINNRVDNCFEESFIANELSSVLDKDIVFYNELNVYKLLLPFKDSVYLKEFYNETILLLKQNDEKYNSGLLETLINYVDLDGDYKKIAKKMFQHENTIRYRIGKIKDILNLGSSNIEFIEQISLAAKIEKILRFSKNNKGE